MEHTTTTKCGRCHRVLTSTASIRRGYGRTCAAKLREAAQTASAGFSAAQQASAAELVADVAMVPLRGARVFQSVSSDGTAYYLTAISGQCNCPAGLKGVRCYHVLAARTLAMAA